MKKTAYEEYGLGKDNSQTADSDSVKSYLADMGDIELLSAYDEKRLSERILRGKCVEGLKDSPLELPINIIEEKGAGYFLEKAYNMLLGIVELTSRRSEYMVCNTIKAKMAEGEDIDFAHLTGELTRKNLEHLKKLCKLEGIELPKFAQAADLSSDCEKIKELHSIIQALKKKDNKHFLLAPETLALAKIEQEFIKECHKITEQQQKARNELTESNLRLVVSIAKKYTTKKLGLSDLIQEGNMGLLIAVDKYDYNKGCRFSTYATYWIRQSVYRAIADNDRTVRIPVHIVDNIQKYGKAHAFLLQQLGREPLKSELADKLGISLKELEEIEIAAADTVSLDEPISEGGDSVLGDFIEDSVNSYADTEKCCDSAIIKEKMDEALNSLPEREQEVLRLRFGFKDGISHTLDEIGKMFGVTRERIRQIEEQALKKLNRPNRARYLDGFLTCF